MKFPLAILIALTTFSACSSSNTEPAIATIVTDSILASPVSADRGVVDTIQSLSERLIQSGDYWLYFKKVDPVQMPEPYPDHLSRQQILDRYDNSFEAAKELEKYLSQTQGEYFHRSGDLLQLRLGNGKTLTLKDHPQEGDEAEYFLYENYFPELDAYLVKVHWYEGSGYLLVERASGEKTEVIGQVYPSRSGAESLSINEDMEAGFTTNGFEWIGKEKGKLVRRLTIVAGDWAPVGVKWENDRNLILKVQRSDDGNMLPVTEYYRLTLQ